MIASTQMKRKLQSIRLWMFANEHNKRWYLKKLYNVLYYYLEEQCAMFFQGHEFAYK